MTETAKHFINHRNIKLVALMFLKRRNFECANYALAFSFLIRFPLSSLSSYLHCMLRYIMLSASGVWIFFCIACSVRSEFWCSGCPLFMLASLELPPLISTTLKPVSMVVGLKRLLCVIIRAMQMKEVGITVLYICIFLNEDIIREPLSCSKL